ncbi:MAG: SDR family oxidoreductase [Anaerolineae bacterium]|nr:SDR family oxidoreductase [Anaerolineae bacterium]
MAKKTYVVTGGAGFIGSHIATRLIQDGQTVRIVDNMLTGKQENLDYLQSLGGDLSIHRVSITEFETLHPVFEGAEVIFHQAALASVPLSVETPLETHAHCVTGTLHVLKAAQETGVRRVVYAASSAAYGDQEGEFKLETMTPAPISPYGAAKLAAEYYCKVFNECYDLETVALRYFNVFGARQDPNSHYAAVIPKFITLMLQGKRPVIFGDGQQSRDFTYIDNVVHGNLLAAEAPDAAGQMMNLATGGQVSLNELVTMLNKVLEIDVAAIHDAPRAGDILHSRANIDKAADLLDFAPIVTFEEGLRRTVAWYKANMESS